VTEGHESILFRQKLGLSLLIRKKRE